MTGAAGEGCVGQAAGKVNEVYCFALLSIDEGGEQCAAAVGSAGCCIHMQTHCYSLWYRAGAGCRLPHTHSLIAAGFLCRLQAGARR